MTPTEPTVERSPEQQPRTTNGLGLRGALRKPRTMPDPEVDWAAWVVAIENEAASEERDGGTTTNCPLKGVHEHAFRGPHRFHEWEPGT